MKLRFSSLLLFSASLFPHINIHPCHAIAVDRRTLTTSSQPPSPATNDLYLPIWPRYITVVTDTVRSTPGTNPSSSSSSSSSSSNTAYSAHTWIFFSATPFDGAMRIELSDHDASIIVTVYADITSLDTGQPDHRLPPGTTRQSLTLKNPTLLRNRQIWDQQRSHDRYREALDPSLLEMIWRSKDIVRHARLPKKFSGGFPFENALFSTSPQFVMTVLSYIDFVMLREPDPQKLFPQGIKDPQVARLVAQMAAEQQTAMQRQAEMMAAGEMPVDGFVPTNYLLFLDQATAKRFPRTKPIFYLFELFAHKSEVKYTVVMLKATQDPKEFWVTPES